MLETFYLAYSILTNLLVSVYCTRVCVLTYFTFVVPSGTHQSGAPSSVTTSPTDPEALFDPATIMDQLRLRPLIGSPAARLPGLHHRVSEMTDKDDCQPGIGLFCRGRIAPNTVIAQAVGVWISTRESNKLLDAGLGVTLYTGVVTTPSAFAADANYIAALPPKTTST